MGRRLRTAEPFWFLWTGFSIIWMSLAAFIGISSHLQNQHEYELLSAEGVWTEGRMVGREEVISYDDDGNEETDYYITYEFFVPDPHLAGDKRRVELQDSVWYDLYQQAEKGRPVRLIYAPSNPEIFRVEERFTPPTQFDLLLTVLFPMFGLPFLLFGLWGIFWKR